MSNSRGSIVVEPLATDGQGNPVAPTPAQAPLGIPVAPAAVAPPAPVSNLVVPNDESIDERYRGKTAGELITMHQNAERKISEQGAEVHTWRNLVSNMQPGAGAAAPVAPQPTETPAIELTGDDLLSNPVESITQVVQHALTDVLGPIEERLAQSVSASDRQVLRSDYPDMDSLGTDEGFITWATASKGRQRDAQLSAAGDLEAQRRLLEAWDDRTQLIAALQAQPQPGQLAPVVPVQPQPGQLAPVAPAPVAVVPTGPAGARAVATEVGGSGVPAQVTLTSDEIVQTIIKDPGLYRSAAYQEKILQASQAGTIAPLVATAPIR